ncbi:putative phosphohistidine phosphatase SixA [Sphingomonas sp. MM-1]|uniref:SixA phosphatase family protein n=1 Tax=Sphingomonas sp. MM-1 TaxID=745310 RepID=UPI0002C1290A|nr:histidine phosphatase family protein [Sphingomonas sp. MM-1]AGH49472.1 putative phosphohistidine phosphatase SixA [Sphingomonas sp. MM-1]
MKRLTLLRHAKSGWDDPVARDFDRPLNPRGFKGARLMGRHMRDLGLRYDLVIASPALRVVETLDGLWEGYGRSLHVELDKRIYLASAATLLDVVQEAPDDADALLLSGHNPGMEDLVLLLVPDRPDDAARDQVEEKFPTAALAEIHIDVDHWADVKAGSGALARFIRPRDLDPALGPEARR